MSTEPAMCTTTWSMQEEVLWMRCGSVALLAVPSTRIEASKQEILQNVLVSWRWQP
jgi:hypothetical protein